MIAPALWIFCGSGLACQGDPGSLEDNEPGAINPSAKQGIKSAQGDKNGPQSPGEQDSDDSLPNTPLPSPSPGDCEEPERIVCDKESEDPLHALGINCPGDKNRISAAFSGPVMARGILSSLGTGNAYHPKEGARYLVMGTGNVAELQRETPASDLDLLPTYCSDDLNASWDKKASLPKPMATNRVGQEDCSQDPSLIGTGDCSNSIQEQWEAAKRKKFPAHDYQELRMHLKVPEWAHSIRFDFAFLTTEYPAYYKHAFNDIFVAWLESKRWTGNISFDERGFPISLNAGFLDYKDVPDGTLKDPACANGCTAPELAGSCLKGHAATKWLTTSAGVTPGEEVELVLAMIDIGDPMMDSFVLLDNFRFSCDLQEEPETEDPPV